MAYHTNHFMGYVMDPITITTHSGDALFGRVKEIFQEELAARGIPACIHEDTVRSGGILFGSSYPILIIHHPDWSCKYFDIGVCVQNNHILFPLLGESAENTKANKKKMLEQDGAYLRAALVKPDEFKLMQEQEWEYDVLKCLLDHFTK